MAEAATFVLTLGDGYSDGVFAGFQVAKVEEHGVGGGAGTPTRAGIVRRGYSIPEIARDRVLVAESGTVATPRRMAETLDTIDIDHVFLGVEFIASTPAAMASAEITQTNVGGTFWDYKSGLETVSGK